MPIQQPKTAGGDPAPPHAIARDTTRAQLTEEVELLYPSITARCLDGASVLHRARLVVSLAERLVQEQRADLPDPDQLIDAFGSALRAARLERRLTLSALHGLSGVHLNIIGGVERGERNSTLRQIARLATALGLSMDELARRAVLARV